MHPARRTALVLALAPWLTLSPIVAPEHVHEADDHHSSAVAHRHFGLHDHDGSELSEADGRVLWLDDVALQRAIYHLALTLAVLPVALDAVPNPIDRIRVSTLDGSPPHGPPRVVASLRGPPASS